VLAGGILTDVLDWHWIFLVNLPIGVLVFALSLKLLPITPGIEGRRIDFAGAITVTGSLMLAVYAIVNGNDNGWTSGQTLGLLAGAVVLLAAFLVIESRIAEPLVPLGIFRHRNVSTANTVGTLMAAGMFAYFFFSALYLQQVLGYTPLEVGLAYLPSTVVWGASSLYSDRFVMRYGIKKPLGAGLGLMALGLLLFARVPVDGNVFVDVIPATLAIGLGGGIAFNPLLLAAMGDVKPEESGLASGIVNTAFMMGGALGLAILASLADFRTDSLLESGESTASALTGGFHAAFLLGAAFVIVAIAVGLSLLRATMPQHHAEPGGEPALEGAQH
jgi:MFS family permease